MRRLPILLISLAPLLCAQQPEFIPFDAARPVLHKMQRSLPAELKPFVSLDSARWDEWVRSSDRAVRKRVEEGEELTLDNLLRQGVTFTKEQPITLTTIDQYGSDRAITSAVQRRATDLVNALSAPHPGEGMLQIRAFLEENGHSLNTPEARKKTREYMLSALARQRDQVLKERKLAVVDYSTAFQARGLSTDSDFYTGYVLQLHLRNLAQRGLLKHVRRVAIIGPGLDFVNKKFGYDFYPPQTIQPFALIDSLARLGLADPSSIEITTFDISRRVNQHIRRSVAKAEAGSPYTIQVLWNVGTGGSPEFLADFGLYTRQFGDRIGSPTEAIPVPRNATSEVTTHAVKIRPAVVKRITPVDMNAIYQSLPLEPGKRFDVVIATNIFIYYDAFEQALARVNVAAMLKPGGLLISNTSLGGGAETGLTDSVETDIPVREGLKDFVFTYLRRP